MSLWDGLYYCQGTWWDSLRYVEWLAHSVTIRKWEDQNPNQDLAPRSRLEYTHEESWDWINDIVHSLKKAWANKQSVVFAKHSKKSGWRKLKTWSLQRGDSELVELSSQQIKSTCLRRKAKEDTEGVAEAGSRGENYIAGSSRVSRWTGSSPWTSAGLEPKHCLWYLVMLI